MVFVTFMTTTLAHGDVYRHANGEFMDPQLAHEGREKERENLQKFGVYEPVAVSVSECSGQRVTAKR